PYGVYNQIEEAIPIPVSHRWRSIPPFFFCGTLHRPIDTSHDADCFTARLQQLRRSPFDRVSTKIFNESNLTFGIACNDILPPVTVPIVSNRRCKYSELYLVGLLPEKFWRQEARNTVNDLAGMFHERYSACLFAYNKIHPAIIVQIAGYG